MHKAEKNSADTRQDVSRQRSEVVDRPELQISIKPMPNEAVN